MKGCLFQQTRLQVQPTGSPVVPLVCSRPFVGVKLPCLDGPRRHKTTVHVHGVGRTMTHPP